MDEFAGNVIGHSTRFQSQQSMRPPIHWWVEVSAPPSHSTLGREALEFALAALAIDDLVTLAVCAPAMPAICADTPRPADDYGAVFASLHLFGVKQLLVDENELAIAGLSRPVLFRTDVQIVTSAEFAESKKKCDVQVNL
jgi:sulfur relay (sulfurtransferase) DsrF/TusC family protein